MNLKSQLSSSYQSSQIQFWEANQANQSAVHILKFGFIFMHRYDEVGLFWLLKLTILYKNSSHLLYLAFVQKPWGSGTIYLVEGAL